MSGAPITEADLHALTEASASLSLFAEIAPQYDPGMQRVADEACDERDALDRIAAALPALLADRERLEWMKANPGRVRYQHGAWFISHRGIVRQRVSFISPLFDTLNAALDYARSGAADTDVDAAVSAYKAWHAEVIATRVAP